MINEETMKIRLLFLLLLSGFVLCEHAQSLYTPGKITEGSLASYYCYAETKLVWKIRKTASVFLRMFLLFTPPSRSVIMSILAAGEAPHAICV